MFGYSDMGNLSGMGNFSLFYGVIELNQEILEGFFHGFAKFAAVAASYCNTLQRQKAVAPASKAKVQSWPLSPFSWSP